MLERRKRWMEERLAKENTMKEKQAELVAMEEAKRKEKEKEEKLARIAMLQEELKKARDDAKQYQDGNEEEEEEGEEKEDEGRIVMEEKKRKGCSTRDSSPTPSRSVASLNLPPCYKAVRSNKIASLAVRHLDGGSAIQFQPIGSFVSEHDYRTRFTHTISDSQACRNISSSFDIEKFICTTCTNRGEHRVLVRKSEGSASALKAPPCFVLADQNFSPTVSVEGEGDCLKIIQVENASLHDLATVFLQAVKGFTVPAGTVILLSSLSHLAAVGTAVYAEDLVRAFRAIKGMYGDGVTVMHGIPLLIHGVSDPSIIRAQLEIEHWYRIVTFSCTKEISRTRLTFIQTLKDVQPSSSTQHPPPVPNRAPERFLLKLPQSLDNYICSATYLSKGFGDQASLCQPISEEEERVILVSLIREVNEKCGLELGEDISTDRQLRAEEEEVPGILFDEQLEKLVIVGGSNGNRICDELLDTSEVVVTDLSVPGWKVTEKSVEEKTAELRDLLRGLDESTTTIVYQLYDDSSYLVKREDGSRVLPEKGKDGR